MNREFICNVTTNEYFALQYFVVRISNNHVVYYPNNYAFHHIYGPAQSNSRHESWRVNNNYYRRHYPHNTNICKITKINQYEIYDEYYDSTFIFKTKNKIICSLIAFSRMPAIALYSLTYEGNSTYSRGELTIKTGGSINTLAVTGNVSADVPEIRLLRRIHATNAHLF
jgi:hypothetical protein